MDSLLRQFNDDKATKEALKEYFEQIIKDYCVQNAFERRSVEGVADAKDILDKAFNQLEIDYGLPNKEKAPTNQAR